MKKTYNNPEAHIVNVGTSADTLEELPIGNSVVDDEAAKPFIGFEEEEELPNTSPLWDVDDE